MIYNLTRAPFDGVQMSHAIAPLSLALLMLVSCGVPSAPRLAHPASIESFCGSREARITGIESVLTSTDDKLLDGNPTRASVVSAVKADGGVIAHWNDQVLKVPNTAEQLGETDGFARVDEVAVPYAPDGATSRAIYLLVKDHGKPRWITMTAYDVQNVCVEGKPQS